MSLIETLHQARKARLKRFAARAVVPAAPEPAHSRGTGTIIARAANPPHQVPDRDYERAWAIAILGFSGCGGRLPGKPRIEEIQRATAHHFGITCKGLLAAGRARQWVRPRQVAMYLAKQLTGKSFPEIGRCFGSRDHTTVLHAVRNIERRLPEDSDLAAHVARIREALEYPEC